MLIMGVRWMDIGIWEPFCFKTRATMMSVLVYSSMSKSLGQGSRRSEERWWWGDRRHFLLLLIHSYRVPRKSYQNSTVFENHRKSLIRHGERSGQTVLPDRSLLIRQKLVENAKIEKLKLKCDILADVQILCFFSL